MIMDFKSTIEALKQKLPKSKSSILLILGIFGLVLILISSFDVSESGAKEQPTSTVSNEAVGSADYVLQVEEKLENVISDMLGRSEVTVMVTLESGTEYVYADEIKTDADVTKDQSALKTQHSDSNQKTYIVVKDSEGNEHPLIVTEKMPTVRGVVVVCEGGETTSVASAVRLAVRSALNVSDDKICIIGRH